MLPLLSPLPPSPALRFLDAHLPKLKQVVQGTVPSYVLRGILGCAPVFFFQCVAFSTPAIFPRYRPPHRRIDADTSHVASPSDRSMSRRSTLRRSPTDTRSESRHFQQWVSNDACDFCLVYLAFGYPLRLLPRYRIPDVAI
jgi:hypothetical protein